MGLVGCISVYGGNSKRLTCYSRPGGIPGRKHPDMFHALRETTRMLGPCCLCPLLDKNGPDYIKAAMYMAIIGSYTGQYVISCANDKCGYLGNNEMLLWRNECHILTVYVVFSEQLYDWPGLHLKVYELRGYSSRLKNTQNWMTDDTCTRHSWMCASFADACIWKEFNKRSTGFITFDLP